MGCQRQAGPPSCREPNASRHTPSARRSTLTAQSLAPATLGRPAASKVRTPCVLLRCSCRCPDVSSRRTACCHRSLGRRLPPPPCRATTMCTPWGHAAPPCNTAPLEPTCQKHGGEGARPHCNVYSSCGGVAAASDWLGLTACSQHSRPIRAPARYMYPPCPVAAAPMTRRHQARSASRGAKPRTCRFSTSLATTPTVPEASPAR